MHYISILDKNKFVDRPKRNKIIAFGISWLMSIVGFPYTMLVFAVKGGVPLMDFNQLWVGVISLSHSTWYICTLLWQGSCHHGQTLSSIVSNHTFMKPSNNKCHTFNNRMIGSMFDV